MDQRSETFVWVGDDQGAPDQSLAGLWFYGSKFDLGSFAMPGFFLCIGESATSTKWYDEIPNF
ncbi:hypothetical protein [Acanthopleuribacter pedis]|uniref:Uncharacterized protein n=1 Tax=Acanthopleuribacter pedis TaxID=442870 RepID=A0A8J7Q5E2_9BACT|nr:hypothetical protein [Acanthopleuribacter pedis]MBO1318447.1 hypothetical protein [Acanthopleuribacter pedis]